ncbi:hypothetical protein ACQ4PT_048226 [Festuca glaucescens]
MGLGSFFLRKWPGLGESRNAISWLKSPINCWIPSRTRFSHLHKSTADPLLSSPPSFISGDLPGSQLQPNPNHLTRRHWSRSGDERNLLPSGAISFASDLRHLPVLLEAEEVLGFARIPRTCACRNMEIQTSGKPIDMLMEKVLCMNIVSSDYFRELYRIKTYHEVIDEIYHHVDHVEPWMTGNCRGPSTAFCLLYKFFTMKLTVKQMHGLLKHPDSPYIRAETWMTKFASCSVPVCALDL